MEKKFNLTIEMEDEKKNYEKISSSSKDDGDVDSHHHR